MSLYTDMCEPYPIYEEIEAEAHEGIWQTKDGKRIPVSEMSDSHLRNTIAYLERKDDCDLMLPWIEVMRNELDKRSKNTNDCIRRDAVLACLKHKWDSFNSADDAMQASIDCIKEMPSVTPTEMKSYIDNCGNIFAYPTERTGHWIEEDMFDGDVAYRCSECNELFWIEDGTPKDNGYNFCPKCGKMLVEPQESEEDDD